MSRSGTGVATETQMASTSYIPFFFHVRAALQSWHIAECAGYATDGIQSHKGHAGAYSAATIESSTLPLKRKSLARTIFLAQKISNPG